MIQRVGLGGVLVVLALCVFGAEAQQLPSTDLIAQANDHLYNLEYEKALSSIESYLNDYPADLQALNLKAVIILRAEMFKRGLLEGGMYRNDGDVFRPDKTPLPEDFKSKFSSAIEAATVAGNDRLKKDESDKQALYWTGVAHGTRGTYLFTLERSYISSLGEAKQANKLHLKLLSIDPSNVDALMIPGTQNYIVGSLPWYIKVLAAMTGTHGNREEGLQQIGRVALDGHYAQVDAKILLALLNTREGRAQNAITLLKPLSAQYPRGYLFPMEIASLCRVLGNWKEASATYENMLKLNAEKVPNFERIPLTRIQYLAGMSYEKQGDAVKALAFYSEAGKGDGIYGRRADLAAADLLVAQKKTEDARVLYQRVADAVPDSDEGKLAQKKLKQIKKSS